LINKVVSTPEQIDSNSIICSTASVFRT